MAGELWQRMLMAARAALEAGQPPTTARTPIDIDVTNTQIHVESRLPVRDTAIACVGISLLAGASLQEARSGGRPLPELDAGHAIAAVRSESLLRHGGEPAGPGFAPLSRFWPAADGWVRTHANYPWHREALLEALGTAGGTADPADRADPAGAADPADVEAVARAIAASSARELEERISAAGGVAAAVRTRDEWLSLPQGRTVAAQPLIAGGRAGDAPPRRRGDGALPASGVRVLDMTRVIAGPVCTRFLAALGADVLRLDPPNRPEMPLSALDGLLGKRSALLDANTAEGRARLHELLGDADVLVHGYRPGALDRFGLTPEALIERHPGLVVVCLTAWGSRGPWGNRRGFDSIVQAASGIAMVESPDGGRPGALPCQLLDHGTGYLCAAAVLDALRRQSGDGGSYTRELSLARTAHWLLSQPRTARRMATSTEATHPQPDRDDPSWLVTVTSASGPITAVSPPGRLDGHGLGWSRALTGYGSDQPQW